MDTNIQKLARFWDRKTEDILNCSHMSLAKKLLAYKIFMRPILIYDWFEGLDNQFKNLEVQALKSIFPNADDECLYDRYTDIDVTKYMKIQEIRWQRSTRAPLQDLRRMINSLSKNAANPSFYFTRANDKVKYRQSQRDYSSSSSTNKTKRSSISTVVRRSRRLADKKRKHPTRRR